jgi:spermidine synthase
METATPAETQSLPDSEQKQPTIILLLSLFILAACGISYELILATISSYLFGDSVYHFSLTIGLFMSAMGVGAYLSKQLKKRLLQWFLWLELLLALLGGFAPVGLLFLGVLYGSTVYSVVLVVVILCLGGLVGLELPLVTRLYRSHQDTLRTTLSSVLTIDYMGSLIGSLLFPLLLFPKLGLMAGGLVLGLCNASAVWMTMWAFRRVQPRQRLLGVSVFVVLVLLFLGAIKTKRLEQVFQRHAFRDRVVLHTRSPYQEIVITQGQRSRGRKGRRASIFAPNVEPPSSHYLPRRWKDDLRLFLNSNIQFSSIDEYRYHEALVHPAMGWSKRPSQILVLGGGDGLALREIVRYKQVKHIDVVDLDEVVIKLFRTRPALKKLNKGAFEDPRVKLHFRDAFQFVRTEKKRYDVVIIDLPDPHSLTLARLYSVSFYRLLKARLASGGLIVTQSSSPFFARRAYWCVHKTIEQAGYRVYPYHVNVPSFGEWGFHLASLKPLPPSGPSLKMPMRFLTEAFLPTMFTFPKDLSKVETSANTLVHPKLFTYYQKDSWIGY